METLIRVAERWASKLGIKFYEIRLVRYRLSSFYMRNSQLEEMNLNHEFGVGIRAYKNGWGFSSANDMKRAEKAVKTAMKIANMGGNGGEIHFGDPINDRVSLKPRLPVESVGLEEKFERLKHFDELLEGSTSKLVSYREIVERNDYANSIGSRIESKVSRVIITLSSTVRSEGKMQRYWKTFGGSGGWEIIEGIDDELVDVIPKMATALIKAKSPPGGKMKVLMDPELTGVFVHEALGHAAEADLVKNGESVLKGKLGERVGPEMLTVVDDPTMKGAYGFYFYDDEGLPGKRVEIVKNGTLVEYLNDRETSRYFEIEPNGHARAESYYYQPLVRMSNTYLSGGDWSFDEMLEDMRNGLYMVGDKGGEVNTATGSFTFGAKLGYRVENGEIKEIVRDVSMSGEVLETLSTISAVGKEVKVGFPGVCVKGQEIPVDDGGPHVLLMTTVGGRSNDS